MSEIPEERPEVERGASEKSKVVEEGHSDKAAWVVMEGTSPVVSECQDTALIREDKNGGFYLVFDGLAGHGDGAYAARQVRDYVDKGHGGIAELLSEADKALQKENDEKPNSDKSATTVAGVLIDREKSNVTLLHQGDSRIYVYQHNIQNLERVTDDHVMSDINEKNRMGVPVSFEYPTSHANKLTRVIGIDSGMDKNPIEVREGALREGDVWFVCTDGVVKSEGSKSQNKLGLTSYEKNEIIELNLAAVSKGEKTPEEAVNAIRELMDGAEDDATMIIVKV